MAFAFSVVPALLATVSGCDSMHQEVDGFRIDRQDTYASHPLTGTTPGKGAPPPLLQIDKLLFVMGQGSGLHGYTIVRIEEGGAGELLIDKGTRAAPLWELISFQVSAADVADLKKLLMDTSYFSLPDMYDTGVQDGGQWFIKVKCTAAKKSVYCNNHIPEQAQRISNFLRQHVLPTAMASKQIRPVPNWQIEYKRVSDGGATY